MSLTIRSLYRRLLKPARPARRARLGLEALEDRRLLAGTITGLVFEDFNANGVFNPSPTLPNAGTGTVGLPADRGLAGVTVTAFDSSNTARGSTVTAADGTYTLTATGTGPYRVEFTTLPAGFFPGPHGPDSGSTVQFVPDGASTAKLGLTRPADYSPDNPPLVVNSYAFGDPLASGNAGGPVIVRLPYSAGTQDSDSVLQNYASPAGQTLATAAQVGATWGLGYDSANQTVYAAAYFKRHAGFGPSGTGAIYQMGLNGTAPTLFADLNALFGPGTAGDNVHNTSDYTGDNFDVAWNAVGKDSLGGLAVSADGSRVYVMNLADRQLYALGTIPAGTTVAYRASIPVAPGATGVTTGNPLGDLRPFAVTVYNGKIYVGMVNSAESTQNAADLKAYVYQVTDTGSSLVFGASPVFQMSLNYPRGLADVGSNSSAAWHPWISTFTNIDTDGAGLVYAQPMLTGLAFDAAGNLVLGFRDRLGDQADAATPISPTNQQTVAAHPAGDTLRAFGNPAAGWVLESNGRGPGGQGTGPQGTGQGPGGGEFYFQDNLPAGRDEVTAGGVLQLANYPDVVVTAYDPVRIGGVFNGGGVRWFNDGTGANDKGYQLFNDASDTGLAFGEANGVGDVTALLDPQPIEIGHRVWKDLNGNGIQDANEPGIAGVTVELFDSANKLVATTVTDFNGNYYFGGGSGSGNSAVQPNTTYQIRINLGQAPLAGLGPTFKNAGTDGSIDSDAALNGSNAVVSFTTGGPGANDPTLDVGFKQLASLSGFVYIDANDNGVRDTATGGNGGNGETGIAGVTLTLTGKDALGNTVNLTTTTGFDGSYSFTDLQASDATGYTLTETQPAGFLDGKNAVGTISGAKVGHLAGPIVDTITGIVLPDGQAGVDYDFGELQPASVSGTVYVDANDNGVLDAGEAPIGGVTVKLTGTDDLGNAVSLTTTTAAADGSYSFTNLRPSGAAGYTLTETQPAGFLDGKNAVGTVNGAADGSLAGPIVDTITAIRLNSGDAGVGYNFGELQPASLAGVVFVDLNNDGVQQSNEPPLPHVTITLTGTDDLGASVSLTTSSATDGSYHFTNLRPGTYTLTETPPGYFALGKTVVGSLGGTAGSTSVVGVTVTSGAAGAGYNFTLLPPASISGRVFADFNNDGVPDGPDFGIAGATVVLTSSDASGNGGNGGNNGSGGNGVQFITTTAADGSFRFDGLAPGTYTITDFISGGFFVGKSVVGSAGGTAAPQQVTGIALAVGAAATGYNFGAVPVVDPAGTVFLDLNRNGVLDPGEPGIPNVQVSISGTDVLGNNVFTIQTTDANGHYQFGGLAPGVYTITENPPLGYFLGALQNGIPPAASVSVANRQFIGIDLTSAVFGGGYNFAHLLAGVPTAINPIGALFPQVDPTFSGKIQLLGNGPVDNTVFVNALYQQILGRAPDVDGLNSWIYQLDVGILSRQQVAAGFWRSAEHRGEQVDLLYLTLLHRFSDPAGRAFWVNQFLQGAGEDDVAAQFFASAEYQAQHSGNATFVAGLYQDVLLRNPDAGGQAFWLQRLQAGSSRADVARAILTSQEGAQTLLNRYYLQYLARTPDPVAEQVWLTPLESGGLATSLVAESIIASDEFLARAKTLAF
jgi:hypothetical protein